MMEPNNSRQISIMYDVFTFRKLYKNQENTNQVHVYSKMHTALLVGVIILILHQ